MTKCGNRSDPQYRAILGVLKQAASSLSLGNLPVQMTLRQRRRIPYLTSPNWFEAVQYLGSTWEGETRDGLDVAGTYSESWMNLFMNFGAHNILTSRFVQSLPVDEYDVPQDIVNPFAVQLTVIAKLVGIIGCDGLEYVDDMPVFTGTRTRLEFRRDGHKAWIGRFTQEPGLSTYMFGNWMTVGKASIHAGGCVLYRLGIVIPLLETQAMEQPPHALIRDLQLKGPSETPFVLGDYEGLRIPALALLAGETPTTSRAFPTRGCRVLEATQELSTLCAFWNNRGHRAVSHLTEYFVPILDHISPVSTSEFRSMTFWSDRLEQRVVTFTKERWDSAKIVGLGFSWLISRDDYLQWGGEDPIRGIKARPAWSSGLCDASLVVLDDALDACDIYLQHGDISSICQHEPNRDKAYFDTCLGCQLQEVDWWLDSKQALAACETSRILHQMAAAGPSTRPFPPPEFYSASAEKRAVRAMLVFRALLIAVRLGLGLDNSDFENTELGNKIVYLR